MSSPYLSNTLINSLASLQLANIRLFTQALSAEIRTTECFTVTSSRFRVRPCGKICRSASNVCITPNALGTLVVPARRSNSVWECEETPKVAHRLVEKAIDFVVGDGEDADYEVYFREFVLEAFRGRGRECRDWISMLRA